MTAECAMINNSVELEKLFAEAAEGYKAQGITATKPKLERVENLNEMLAAADVRWASLDAANVEKASERSYYIVQLEKDGDAHIRVALTRTE